MADGTVFPAFLKLEYQRDNSAKSTFLAEVASISGDAKRQFEQAFGEIGKTIERSLTSFKSGGLKFDVDLTGLRQAASEADHTAQRTQALRDAAITLAAATGDTSQATQKYLQGLRAQAIETGRASSAAQEQVSTYSRLQSQIDKTISSNDRLAASYRATFAEQAKATNFAHSFQQGINQVFAPGLAGPSKSARESASVFESQSYAPKADTSSGLDRMRNGAASIDRAALSGATLEQVLGRVSAKGKDVAGALQEAERAAAALAATQKADQEIGLAKAAADAKAYAAAAAQLRSELDPAIAIQNRYAAALDNADKLLEVGAIDHRTYAQAVAKANADLASSWQALTGAEAEHETVRKRGTSETGNVINGIRAQRVAFTQLGQQMQDVVVQTQMGTSATTIFVQQVPQMAFALSGLSENTNKTYAAIGKAATFLAGPWGAAIFAATAILGPMIAGMIDFGDATDKAVDKLKKDAAETETTRKAKEIFKQTEEGVRQAILDQKDALDKQADSLRTEAQRSRDAAKANLDHEVSIRKTTQALLEQAVAQEAVLQQRAQAEQQFGTRDTAGLALPIAQGRVSALQGKLDEASKALETAQKNFTEAQSHVAVERGGRSQQQIIEDGYKVLIDQARQRAVAEGKTSAEIERQTKALQDQKKAKLDALSASQRSSGGQYGREIDLAQATSIASSAGFQVNSGHRSYAEQKSLYDKWVAQGKPSNNPVAMPGTSAHERDNALDIQYGNGVSADSIRKAYKEEGVRLTKILAEKGHFHIEWSTSGADRVQKEADQLAKFSATAGESIQRINERFNEQPRLIDSANAATRELNATIDELGAKQPPGFKELIADAEKAKQVVQDSLVRPYQELERDSQRRMQIQDLLSQGREAEAAAMQEIWTLEQKLGPMTAERRAEVLRIAEAEQKHIEALQRVQEMQQAYLDATRSVRSEVEAILGGYGKLSNLKGVFQQLRGKVLTEQIFGDVFRDMDKWVKEKTGIGSSVDMMATETERAGSAAGKLADALSTAAARIADGRSTNLSASTSSGAIGSTWALGAMSVPSMLAKPEVTAANDNGEIVVTGRKSDGKGKSVNDLTPERYFERMSAILTKPLLAGFGELLGPNLAKALSGPLSGALEGYLTTGTGFGAVLGGLKDIKGLPDGIANSLGKAFKGAQTGSMVAGIGNSLGLGLSDVGSQIGGAIGSFIPIPGGDIIGSIAGGLIGKLFGKRPRGGGAVTQDSVSVHANDNAITDAMTGFGSSVQSAISKIADQFGAQVGNYDVGIGRYKDYYQVSAVGNDSKLGGTYFDQKSSNALYDGKDPEEAMRAALLNAIQDGAIKGIREGSLRLLKAGKDLDTQVQKALDFENVFKRLKAYEDPVGAALDTLNTEFTKLKATFAEASASAADYAALEKLYGIERAKAIQAANDQILSSLRDLMSQLTVNNPTRSFRERETAALAVYDPLKQRVAAGDTTAYADYAKASQDLLAIEREMYGSTQKYFAMEDEIKALAQSTIDKATAVSDAAANRDSPFSSTGTAATNDNASVTSAITSQTNVLNGQLIAANDNLAALLKQNTALSAAIAKAMGGSLAAAARGNF